VIPAKPTSVGKAASGSNDSVVLDGVEVVEVELTSSCLGNHEAADPVGDSSRDIETRESKEEKVEDTILQIASGDRVCRRRRRRFQF